MRRYIILLCAVLCVSWGDRYGARASSPRCCSVAGWKPALHESLPPPVTADSLHAELKEVRVHGRKAKYRRKNNPAVEMILKVIAHKRAEPPARYQRTETMTMALNEVKESIFEEGRFKRMPFLKHYVERHPVTGKLVLPFVADEKVVSVEDGEPTVLSSRHVGMDDLLKTGEVLRGLMDDCFTDVNLYDDDIRLLQYHFISPIASSRAVSFYHYFIEDTVEVDSQRCFKLGYSPANPQDFGFSGALYILADSTWRVHRAEINVPYRSDINFVDQLDIRQRFITLPTGDQFLAENDMILQLSLFDFLQKLQVERVVRNWGGRLSACDNWERRPPSLRQPQAESLSPQLSDPFSAVDSLKRDFLHTRFLKPLLWVSKAFIESYIETTLKPDKKSYVDIGPVYQFVGSNFVEGFRVRVGAQTTAHLSPHWFVSGWGKYGFKDRKWKGEGSLTYSPRRREYFTQEFPVSNLTFTYTSDVRSPADHFLGADRDGAFSAAEWAKTEHMNYFRRYQFVADWEWRNGLRLTGQLRRQHDTPAWEPASEHTYAEASLGLTFQPGASYVCTKMNRLQTNFDTPVLTLRHTVGVKGVWGGDYNYNYTEASVYKRFWLRAWGKMDCLLRGAVEWNRVPWTLLVMPPANTSYLLDKNRQLFTLMRDMELLSDRAVSLTIDWDLNGRLLNRIPLMKKLKWRENIGLNAMWGQLSRRNNTALLPVSHAFNPQRPYVELTAGVHNVFRFFRIEYVRRLTYLHECKHKWGIRGAFEFSF